MELNFFRKLHNGRINIIKNSIITLFPYEPHTKKSQKLKKWSTTPPTTQVIYKVIYKLREVGVWDVVINTWKTKPKSDMLVNMQLSSEIVSFINYPLTLTKLQLPLWNCTTLINLSPLSNSSVSQHHVLKIPPKILHLCAKYPWTWKFIFFFLYLTKKNQCQWYMI